MVGIQHPAHPWVHHCRLPPSSTRDPLRDSSDEHAALRRAIAELTFTDERVTVAQRVSPFIHPFHCWLWFTVPIRSPKETRREGGMLCREVSLFTHPFHCWTMLRTSRECQQCAQPSVWARGDGPLHTHPFHCWSLRKVVNSRSGLNPV